MSRAIERAFAILEFLGTQPEPVGVREIAGSLEMPPAAAQRVLVTLARLGMINRDPITRRYELGHKVLQLAQRFLEHMGLPRIAESLLREIRDRCDETVSLFITNGRERVCVASEESTREIRRVLHVGTSLPLWAGASGKLLLAHLVEDEGTNVLEHLTIRPFTKDTVTDRETLRKELERVREKGYATSFGERVPEAASVAAPVRDGEGTVVAAFTISAPSARWTEARGPLLIDLALEGAARLSERLGYEAGRTAEEQRKAQAAAETLVHGG